MGDASALALYAKQLLNASGSAAYFHFQMMTTIVIAKLRHDPTPSVSNASSNREAACTRRHLFGKAQS
jgi:hypothetical protein